jgi:hypothetical protein
MPIYIPTIELVLTGLQMAACAGGLALMLRR